jgi:hypothetical protein
MIRGTHGNLHPKKKDPVMWIFKKNSFRKEAIAWETPVHRAPTPVCPGLPRVAMTTYFLQPGSCYRIVS